MAEALTIEEQIELYNAVFSNVNTQFELWLTITFAVIIASYIAGHKLSRSLQYLVAVLYTLVSLLLLLMLINAIRFLGELSGVGIFADSDDPLTVVIVVLRMFVWFVGSGATLVFIFKGQSED